MAAFISLSIVEYAMSDLYGNCIILMMLIHTYRYDGTHFTMMSKFQVETLKY